MKVLIVDDHPLILMALQHAICTGLNDCSVETTQFMDAAEVKLAQRSYDLLILDVYLEPPFANRPFEQLERVRRQHPSLNVILISGADVAQHAHQAVALGAKGFVSKGENTALLLAAVQIVMMGGTYFPSNAVRIPSDGQRNQISPQSAVSLTRRQEQVLELLLNGYQNKRIAAELDISLQTVKVHVTAIMGALQVQNRTQVLVAATQLDKLFDGWRKKSEISIQAPPR